MKILKLTLRKLWSLIKDAWAIIAGLLLIS
jgi:hypothetical protein